MTPRASAAAGIAAALWATPAVAEETDGAYGRIEGDLLFVGALGVGVEAGGPVFETHVELAYLSTAGIYVRYTDAFGAPEPHFERTLAAGVDIRPLFLGRWALDLEQGPAHLDLFVDSLSLFAGAVWSSPQGGRFDEAPGIELGAGIEFPLLPSTNGPYVGVQAMARWGPTDLDGRTERDLLERGSMIVFFVAWHQVFDGGIVDLRDSRDEDR